MISLHMTTNRRLQNGLLPAAVDSILAQTYGDFELIVCDDASSDGTAAYLAAVAARESRVRVFRNERNEHSVAISLGRCFSRADPSRPFISWMFDDNLLAPDALETLVAAARETPEYPVLYGRTALDYADGRRDLLSALPVDEIRARIDGDSCLFPNAGVLFHRDVFDTVGWYDASILLRRSCDWDLFRRLFRAGIAVRGLDRLVAIERGPLHADSLRNAFVTDLALMRKYADLRDAAGWPVDLVAALHHPVDRIPQGDWTEQELQLCYYMFVEYFLATGRDGEAVPWAGLLCDTLPEMPYYVTRLRESGAGSDWPAGAFVGAVWGAGRAAVTAARAAAADAKAAAEAETAEAEAEAAPALEAAFEAAPEPASELAPDCGPEAAPVPSGDEQEPGEAPAGAQAADEAITPQPPRLGALPVPSPVTTPPVADLPSRGIVAIATGVKQGLVEHPLLFAFARAAWRASRLGARTPAPPGGGDAVAEAEAGDGPTDFLTERELDAMGLRHRGSDVLISRRALILRPHALRLGHRVRIDAHAVLSVPEAGIAIGNHVHIAVFAAILGRQATRIDDYGSLSPRATILTSNDDWSGEHLMGPMVDEAARDVRDAPVVVGAHAAVGAGSVVLPGVTLHAGSAVGALSLVKEDVPALTIVAGVPAAPIGHRSQGHLALARSSLGSGREM